MATTRSSEENGGVCPLCEGRLAHDHRNRRFVRHLERPDQATVERILASPTVSEEDKAYLRETGCCPFERGERD